MRNPCVAMHERGLNTAHLGALPTTLSRGPSTLARPPKLIFFLQLYETPVKFFKSWWACSDTGRKRGGINLRLTHKLLLASDRPPRRLWNCQTVREITRQRNLIQYWNGAGGSVAKNRAVFCAVVNICTRVATFPGVSEVLPSAARKGFPLDYYSISIATVAT
jgi:hypothetical protein